MSLMFLMFLVQILTSCIFVNNPPELPRRPQFTLNRHRKNVKPIKNTKCFIMLLYNSYILVKVYMSYVYCAVPIIAIKIYLAFL